MNKSFPILPAIVLISTLSVVCVGSELNVADMSFADDCHGWLAVTEPSPAIFKTTDGNLVRRIDSNGTISTYAGTGEAGFSGDDGPAESAKLNNPAGLALDEHGNLYIAEFVNNRIRRVDAVTHTITTVAGNGLPHRIDVLM
jgi:hypothetical protein